MPTNQPQSQAPKPNRQPDVRPAPGALGLPLVMIRGAGDLATGVAIRLFRSGFPVVMTEIAQPLAVRRAVAFAQAVFDGETQVEEVRAVRCAPSRATTHLREAEIPVLVDPRAEARLALHPPVLVNAVMAKVNKDTSIKDAPIVVALGPGFTAGVDCHAVIETNRGHNLGRVIWEGAAEADTGRSGALTGVAPGLKRALYAPVAGTVEPHTNIGDRVRKHEPIASVNSPDLADPVVVTAAFDGVLRGIIHPSVHVGAGVKIGDLDPRIQPSNCFTVSDKSLAIGGGVLEVIMTALHRALLPSGQRLKDGVAL